MDGYDVLATQKSYSYNYLNFLPKSHNAKIVDLGCSEGISLEWLLLNGYQNIVGVDSDEFAIELCRKKFNSKLSDKHIVCFDALSYLKNCEDESVDMVLMLNVIEHIPKETILEIMSEIRRTLKCDGCFLAQTGNWENPFNIGLFTRDFTHQVMYTMNSLRQLMIMSNFDEDEIILKAVRYKLTWRNFPLQISSVFSSWLVKIFSLSMRIHIREMAPIIFCLVRK